MQARRKARRASCEWKADAEWKLGRPRDCWENRSAVLHLHTNWCVCSMALFLWTPKLRERVCARRCYTSWRSSARRIFTPSPLQPCRPDFWRVFWPKPGAGDLAIESSKLEFWHAFQPKPGAGDLAIESSKLEFWRHLQPKPGAGDLAIEPSKLEFWRVFQPKPGVGDLAIEPSKPEFWPQFRPKPGAGDLAIGSSKLEFWQVLQPKPGASDLAIAVFKAWVLALAFNQSLERVDLAIESSKHWDFGNWFQPKPGAGDLPNRVFRACFLAALLTQNWSGWTCHRVFKAWVLAVSSSQLSGWPCHRVFKSLSFGYLFQPKPGAGDLAIESSKLEFWF